MAEYTAITPDGKYLLHYGVKGMKWGKTKKHTQTKPYVSPEYQVETGAAPANNTSKDPDSKVRRHNIMGSSKEYLEAIGNPSPKDSDPFARNTTKKAKKKKPKIKSNEQTKNTSMDTVKKKQKKTYKNTPHTRSR